MLSPNTYLQNRYRIIRILGRGGMGHVYEAIDEAVECIVAIKETVADSDKLRRAFEREAKLLANLRHAVLPRVTHYFFEEDRQYLVMDFIEGLNLMELLALRHHPFSYDEVLPWTDELLKGLEYLHNRPEPIIHRDIKPANIKLSKEGQVYLLDFGLAKGTAGQMSVEQTSNRGVSIYGYTEAYASPEQLYNSGTDTQSDLYSLGATLYHLLTGQVPTSSAKRDIKIAQGQPDPMLAAHFVNPYVPHPLSLVISHAMMLDRESRIASASIMRRALKEALLAIEAARQAGESQAGDPYGSTDEVEAKALAWQETKSPDALARPPDEAPASLARPTLPTETNRGTVRIESSTLNAPSAPVSTGAPVEQPVQSRAEPSWPSQITSESENSQAVPFTPEQERRDEEAAARRWQQEEEERRALEAEEEARQREAQEQEAIATRRGAEEDEARSRRDDESAEEQARLEREQEEKQYAATLLVAKEEERRSLQERLRGEPEKEESRAASLPDEKPSASIYSSVEVYQDGSPASSSSPVKTMAFERPDARLLASSPQAGAAQEVKPTTRSKKGSLLYWLVGCVIVTLLVAGALIIQNRRSAREKNENALSSSSVPRVDVSNLRGQPLQPPPVMTSARDLAGQRSVSWSVSFSPDGRTVVSGSNDRTVRVWDTQSRKLLRTMEGHEAGVNSVAVSPDGRTIASASNDRTIKLWDAKDGTLLKTLSGHEDEVYFVAYAPDGRRLASAGKDRKIKLWDAPRGRALKTLSGHSDVVWAVAFAPDGKSLASASKDRTVKVWDTESGKELKTLTGHGGAVVAVAFSHDGRILACGSDDKLIKLWATSDWQALKTLSGHDSYITALAFTPDDRTLASASNDTTLMLWNIETGESRQRLTGHTKGVNAVAFSPDAKLLVSGSKDETVKVWQ